MSWVGTEGWEAAVSPAVPSYAVLPGNSILELLSGLVVDGYGYPGICVKDELNVVVDLSSACLFSVVLHFLSTSGKSQKTAFGDSGLGFCCFVLCIAPAILELTL